MEKINNICVLGGRSIDTVLDSDLDKFLYFLHELKQPENMHGFYSVNLCHGFEFNASDLFTVGNN